MIGNIIDPRTLAAMFNFWIGVSAQVARYYHKKSNFGSHRVPFQSSLHCLVDLAIDPVVVHVRYVCIDR
jgi:hypothetical protein